LTIQRNILQAARIAGRTQPLQEDRLRTLVICVLATTLVGCSSQQPTQPSCFGLNPFACLTAVQVPIEPESHGSDSATAEPVSLVVWRGDSPPRSHADHAVRRRPKPIKVAAKAAPAVPIPIPSPQANQQTTGNAVASEAARASEAPRASATNPSSTSDDPQTRTTQEQVAAASAVAERMSVPTLDASLDALVAILVAGTDVKSVADLAGKTIAIDDRYSESSISRVRTAMAAAGAPEVQLSKGQTTAINRLVAKEVPAAVVGLVSANAADSFPELARLRIFRVPLSARSSPGKP
jgi:ABC-type amino acid transport substrate-binding protein